MLDLKFRFLFRWWKFDADGLLTQGLAVHTRTAQAWCIQSLIKDTFWGHLTHVAIKDVVFIQSPTWNAELSMCEMISVNERELKYASLKLIQWGTSLHETCDQELNWPLSLSSNFYSSSSIISTLNSAPTTLLFI